MRTGPPTTRRRVFAAAATLAVVAGIVAGQGIAAASEHNQDVYVSPYGSDGAPGTWHRPVRTVAKAQQLVRARDQHLGSDLTVHLAPGTYRLTQPLELTTQDSGSNGHRVDLAGQSGHRVQRRRPGHGLAPGGRPARSVRRARAGRAGQHAAALRRRRARAARFRCAAGHPEVHRHRLHRLRATSCRAGATPATSSSSTRRAKRVWNLQRDGLGQWTRAALPDRLHQRHHDHHGPAVLGQLHQTRGVPEHSRPQRQHGRSVRPDQRPPARPTWRTRSSCWTQPGQWYLDRSAHTVYYLPTPRREPAAADVEMPALQQLVDGQGTASAPLHDVAFRGHPVLLRDLADAVLTGGLLRDPGRLHHHRHRPARRPQGLCQFAPGGTCPYASWTPEPGNVPFSHGHRSGVHRQRVHPPGRGRPATGRRHRRTPWCAATCSPTSPATASRSAASTSRNDQCRRDHAATCR